MDIDKSNLRSVILDSVKQLNAPLAFFDELNLTRRPFDKVLLCGMGGSALMGDFLTYFQDAGFSALAPRLPVCTHRSYGLPAYINENTLIICVSYSGQTEETLSAFEAARKNNLAVAGITCGGQLGDLCQKYGAPWIQIPQNNIPPRLSLGYQLAAIAKILMAYGLLSHDAQNTLASLTEKIVPAELENRAKIICAKLGQKIPVIYASQADQILAKLWKIAFNENAKIPAFYNFFPELNHNEMVGWTKPLGPFAFIFLRDNDGLPRIKKRMTITAELLRQQQMPVEFLDIPAANPPEKIFWAAAFAHLVSYHLALFYGIDPAPVEMVEEFKKMMKE